MVSDSNAINNNVFGRKHSVTPKQLSALQELFPGWTFNFGNDGVHPHPISATERAITEELMYRDIMRTYPNCSITDIGGNANRHASCQRMNIHCCNPILSGVDALRRHKPSMSKLANVCNNKAQDCEFRPDVYMSVHSLYYLKRSDILSLLLRSRCGVLFATLHRYDDVYGSDPNGESHYQYVASGKDLVVSVQVNGNLAPYVHPTMSWLSDGYFECDGYAMAWDAKQVNTTWIFKFIVTNTGLQVNPTFDMSLVSSLDRNDHYGSVKGITTFDDEAKLKPALEVMNLTDKKMFSFGKFLWITDIMSTTRQILIPKSIVQHVALKMVGVTRDKAGLKMCIKEMKTYLNSSRMSIPISIKLDCAIYGSSLAFILHLRDEVLSFSQLCNSRYRRLSNMLNRAMTFETYICCTIPYFEPDHLMTPEAVSKYNTERVSVPSEPFNAKKYWPNGLPGYESTKKLKNIRKKAIIKNHSTETQDFDDKQAYSVAITFSENIPRFPVSSINNETIGLCNRALMVVPKEDEAEWALVHKYTNFQVVVDFDSWPITEDGWFSDWNSLFPKGQQKRHLTAKAHLDQFGLEPKDFLRKSFAKREATLKGVHNIVDFDPRIIQGASDKYNVALAPWMRVFGKLLAAKWNIESRICYTSGLTGEDLGVWRSTFGNDEVTIIEIDHSRYDAHQGKYSVEFETKFYQAAGSDNFPLVKQALDGSRLTSGYTSHGVKYSVPYTRRSGDPNTSCGNSLVNGATADYVLSKVCMELGLKTHNQMRMLVLGDDNLIVLPGRLTSDQKYVMRLRMMQVYLKLGYEITMKIHDEWSQAEFCSSLFWPVSDGFVLGPKIGRRLPKLGWSLSNLKPGEVKGMMLGMNKEFSAIPVVRHYPKHCLKLLKYVKKIDYEDKDAKFKSTIKQNHQMSDDTKLFFYERYGYDLADVEEQFLKCLSQCDTINTCVSFPLLDELMLIDVGEE